MLHKVFRFLLVGSLFAVLALAVWPASTAQASAGGSGCASTYTVRRGDTLSAIARAHKITVAELMKLNGLANANRILVGQTLCLKAAPPTPTPAGVWYTVQQGDTLSRIAQRHGVSMDAIVKANKLANPNRIVVGQKLWIPKEPNQEGFWYTVQRGDTVSALARRYGTTVDAIVKANKLASASRIAVGQKLWIPAAEGSVDRPNGPVVHAYRRQQPPAVDAQFTDWNRLPWSVDRPVFGRSNWAGPADQSAVFNIAWDAANLYLAVTVTDDEHVQTQLGEMIFKGDSLEILLDTDLRGDFASAKLSGDDFQLGLTPGEAKIGGPDAWLWQPVRLAGRAQATVAARQSATPGGYHLEAAIPWSVFGVSPAAGMKFGFALSSSDNDTPGAAQQQSMVSTVPGRVLADPTTWGTLVLD